MKQYLDLLNRILDEGNDKGDRTGTGTVSVFGHQMRFDLKEGFPLVTTKKLHIRSIVHELLWFLKGDTNIKYLKDHGVRIWDEWATENGDLGPVYGKQWTAWETPNGETINQIAEVVEMLKVNPNSRRMIVTGWNPADLPDESISPQANVENGKMALATCHAFFQFYTRELSLRERIQNLIETLPESGLVIKVKYGAEDEIDNDKVVDVILANADADEAHGLLDEVEIPRLAVSCQLYQRSADTFLGVPFNIASYAILTHMVAQQTGYLADEFVWTGGDVHLYNNTIEQATEQLKRKPFPLPRLVIKNKPDSIFDYKFEDFEIMDYESHPHIKAQVSV